MDALIEDGLTRMAIMLEVNSHYGVRLAQDYERLLADSIARAGLEDELTVDLEQTQQRLIDEAIARAGPSASSGYFTMGFEETGASEIGRALDALVAVGAVTEEDAQAFLRERIRSVAAYWETSGAIADEPALLAHFDVVRPDLPGDVAYHLRAALHHVGLVSDHEFERRSYAARNTGTSIGDGPARRGPRRCRARLARDPAADLARRHRHRLSRGDPAQPTR